MPDRLSVLTSWPLAPPETSPLALPLRPSHYGSSAALINFVPECVHLPFSCTGSIGGDPWVQSVQFLHVRNPACLRHETGLAFHALRYLFVGSSHRPTVYCTPRRVADHRFKQGCHPERIAEGSCQGGNSALLG
jgi:hypothetical protein